MELITNILDAAPVAFLISAYSLQKMLFVSAGYEKIWQRPRAPLYVDHNASLKYVNAADLHRVGKSYEATPPWNGRPKRDHFRIYWPDGQVRWIEMINIGKREKQEIYIYQFHQDITSWKGPAMERFGQLTRRERSVLQLLLKNMSIEEIADAFTLSLRTVKPIPGRIYWKLGVADRASAVEFCLRNSIDEGYFSNF